ncbi:MAG: AI-2E family transporter, partial [Oscillospiraceae bacterium]|nr:AI-2E family transporter [Oscillospiraceae bacterium]
MEWNRKTIRSLLGVIAFAIVLFVGLSNIGAVFLGLKTALGMGAFAIVGGALAFVLSVPMDFIETKLLRPINRRLGNRFHWDKARRAVSLLLALLLVLSVLAFVVFMVIPELLRTFAALADQMPAFIEEATAWLEQIAARTGRSLSEANPPQIDWVKLGDAALELAQQGGGVLFAGTVNAFGSVASALFNFGVGLAMAVYLLMQKERLARQASRALYAFLPQKRVDAALDTLRLARGIFRQFIGGQFLEAIILGSCCFLGMWILGFPFAPMIAVLIGVSSFIPMFGAFLAAAVGVFLMLVNVGALTALWFLVFIVLLQQAENNLIYPHVVGKSVQLPGLWVLVAVTLGSNIAGIVGMMV